MDITFEQAITELESIVEKLNSGGAALDEMVSLYERGAALAEHCRGLLDKYEGRMEKAVRNKEAES